MSLVHRLQLAFLFQLLIDICLVFALPAPYNNGTAPMVDTPLGKIAFQPEPTGRGTVGILISCTATYIFCVWTAVHPNINVKTSAGSRLWYKSALMVLSVIVPEGLLVCAFGQRREAIKLKAAWDEKMKSILEEGQNQLVKGSQERKQLDKRIRKVQKQLGLDGAFFVVMGGFLTDTIKTDENNIILGESLASTPASELKLEFNPKCKIYTSTLTPAGFIKYLNLGYIDQNSFDKSDITDKGKANNIAKLLACVQALWLIVQSAARWGSHLRVTLLEIHVLIQVFCTTFIYFCWWYKPLDVDEPITIKLVTPLQAPRPPDLHRQDEFEVQRILTQTYEKEKILITKEPCPDSIAVKAKAFFDLMTYLYSEDERNRGGARYAAPGGKKKQKMDGLIAMIVEGSLVVVVGGLHLTAWNVHFPSRLESHLWKGCSFGMIFFPAVIVFIVSFTRYERDLFNILWKAHFGNIKHRGLLWFGLKEIHGICKKHSPDRKSGGFFRHWRSVLWHYSLVLTCLLALLMYALCTTFIVVESYISMRDPPEGVFLTPKWSDYWPHF